MWFLLKNLDLEKFADTDSEDSETDDNEMVTQNLTETANNSTAVQKSESVKFEIPFNYWKDCNELELM